MVQGKYDRTSVIRVLELRTPEKEGISEEPRHGFV